MAQYEQKDNDGAAFPVESKTEDWHDDYSGKIMVEGEHVLAWCEGYEVQGWGNPTSS